MDLNSTISLAIAAAFLAEVIMYLSSSSVIGQNVVIVAPRVKSVCSFVPLVQTNLDHSRSHKIEKNKNKNGFGPFSYKFFVPTRVGLTHGIPANFRGGLNLFI